MAEYSFTVVAHRGISAHFPENTLAAFDAALAAGFAHFETDCQLTLDSEVVILHDEQLGRTTRAPRDPADSGNGGGGGEGARQQQQLPQQQGPVAGVAWRELSSLDAGGWFGDGRWAGERVPLLAELLARYRGRAHVHLELKSQQPDLPARVAEQLAACGWVAAATAATAVATAAATASHPPQHDVPAAPQPPLAAAAAADAGAARPHPHFDAPLGITITSFHLQQLRRSVQLLPALVHGWLIHELTQERIEEALTAGVRQLCPRANVLTREGVRRATAAGMSVRAWGIRDTQLLLRAVGCGCHGATVNWPSEAREALAAPGAAAAALAAAEEGEAEVEAAAAAAEATRVAAAEAAAAAQAAGARTAEPAAAGAAAASAAEAAVVTAG